METLLPPCRLPQRIPANNFLMLRRFMGGFPRPLNPKWVGSRHFHFAGKMHILRNNSILQNYLYFYNNGLYLAILLAESTPASGTLVMRREASPR